MAPRFLRINRSRAAAFDSTERSLFSPIELKRPGYRALYWGICIFLVLLTITTLFPLLWMFTGAIKTPTELFRRPPTLFPENPQWHTYATAWRRLDFTRFFGNTLGIALGSWILQLFVTTTAAYSLSKLKPAFGNLLLFLFFSTIMVPGALLLIPRYLTVVSLPILGISLLKTWWAIWLPGAVNGFNIFLLKTFFDQIPSDLTDAAHIDGANAWQIFWRVVLPLSRAALVVVTITSVIGSWQDFFWPFLVLTGATEKAPIMVVLFGLTQSRYGSAIPLNVSIAASAIAAIPPVILFLIFQKQIIRGINLTGLQG